MPVAAWLQRDLAEDLARLDPPDLARVLRQAADLCRARRDIPRDVHKRLWSASEAARYGCLAAAAQRADGAVTVVRYLPHGMEPGQGEAVQPLAGHHAAHASLAVRR